MQKNKTILCLSLLVLGCTNSSPVGEGSVLVLAFSGISADQLSGINVNDVPVPQVDAFLDESVRMTHAYTTSSLENAGLASALTGLYPFETEVRKNDSGNYKENTVSLPEELSAKGWSTIFISGGAPFLRKVATSKGFNYFDDLFVSPNPLAMTFKDVTNKFLSQITLRSDGNKFFSVLYFSNVYSDSNIKDLDESLGMIKSKFQKWKIWDQTTVILMGLKGKGRSYNLNDETFHIPLVIKPSRKPRDLSPSLKIDRSVNLADLGQTLFSLTGVMPKKTSQLAVIDFSQQLLDKGLRGAESNLKDDRVLLFESDVLNWRKLGSRQWAIRKREWVYSPTEKKLFNTYVDRLEQNNLFHRDLEQKNELEKDWNKIQEVLSEKIETKTDENLDAFVRQVNLAKSVFSKQIKVEDKEQAFQEYFYWGKKKGQPLLWYMSFLFENKKLEKAKKEIQWAKKFKTLTPLEVLKWEKILQISNPMMMDCEKSIAHFKSKKK